MGTPIHSRDKITVGGDGKICRAVDGYNLRGCTRTNPQKALKNGRKINEDYCISLLHRLS